MISAATVAAAAAAAGNNDNNYQNFNNLQQQQQQQANRYHQELVKSYLNQQHQTSLSSSLISPVSSNHSLAGPLNTRSALPLSAHQIDGQSPQAGAVASFAARLMSLNAYELKCLNDDNELVRRISETQSMMESRLQDIKNQNSTSNQTNNRSVQQHHNQQQQQQQQQVNQIHQQNQQQLNKLYQQQMSASLMSPLNLNSKLPLQEQHQQFLLSSPTNNNYYQNYYSQQILMAHQQMAQQMQHHQEQQQQLYLLNSRLANGAINNLGKQSTTLSETSPSEPNSHSGATQSVTNDNNRNQRSNQPALDLRTTPTMPISHSPLSPISSRAASTGSSASYSNKQQNPSATPQQHPKKMKLSEYRKQNNIDIKGGGEISNSSNAGLASPTDRTNVSAAGSSSSSSASSDYENNQNMLNFESATNNKKRTLSGDNKGKSLAPTNCEISNGSGEGLEAANVKAQSINLRTNSKQITLPKDSVAAVAPVTANGSGGSSTTTTTNTTTTTTTTTSNNSKKYKGEFDEPSPQEVAQRQLQLNKPDHYHRNALECGECACVIGSEFRDKTKQDALQLLENWRSLDIAERIKYKWDVNDLPKDIPLSDIKKFEDLRRDFSMGRADFGGASKRKPLGIRGTRQFLLMLYCLWGHPGREDPMQQDGYCPHCFAKIRTENEQSTLVRVVNHFNMKHRRGANPRLSPRLEAANQPNSLSYSAGGGLNKKQTLGGCTHTTMATFDAQSPQLEVAHTLLSMVESSVKETGDSKCKIEKSEEEKRRKSAAIECSKSPHLDSENLDPCSVGLVVVDESGDDDSIGTIVTGDRENQDNRLSETLLDGDQSV